MIPPKQMLGPRGAQVLTRRTNLDEEQLELSQTDTKCEVWETIDTRLLPGAESCPS